MPGPARVRRWAQHYGLDRLVDLMIFSDEEAMAKPDARIYHLAAARLGVQPDEAIFVDDVPRNVEAARAVGMLAVHFRDTAQAIAEIEQYLESGKGQTRTACCPEGAAESAERTEKKRGSRMRFQSFSASCVAVIIRFWMGGR